MRLSDQIREEMDDGNITLLPTPVAQPSGNAPEDHLRKKPGRMVVTDLAIITENGLLASGGKLLPTPKAHDGEFATPSTTGRPSHMATHLSTRIVKGGEILLPTPGAYDGERGGSQHPDKRRAGGHSVSIQDVAEHLIPTPRALRGGSATETMYQLGAERVDAERAQGQVTGDITGWGPYAAAIARWEAVIWRPAPAPVRYDGKGGKPRLNPELTEWMMGWSQGHVTNPAIGLTRSEQLKACGNGVVPLQAVAALRELLARPGVPSVQGKAVAA